jgi:hypothetical protein
MDESVTRAKISAIAATVEGCDADLRSLPVSRESRDAHQALATAATCLRLWAARVPDPQPRPRLNDKRTVRLDNGTVVPF